MTFAAIDSGVQGAFIALCGVLIGQIGNIIAFFVGHSREQKRFQREKCELLSTYVVEANKWFSSIGQCMTLDDMKKTHPPEELTKATMLAVLYFKDLETVLINYSQAVMKYHSFLLNYAPMSAGVGSVVAIALTKNKALFIAHQNSISSTKQSVAVAISDEGKKLL